MANKNFTVKNGLEVGGQEVISSSGTITSAALGGQTLGTTDSPTFANATLTGSLRGPSTFTIDPAAVGDNTGTLVIAGNLQVDGTTTTINSTTMEVDDLNLTLASGAANAAAANGAGINVDIVGATNPSLVYGSSNDDWTFNKNLNVTGNGALSGNLDVVGQIGAYDNPGSAWGKMILRATDFEFKNAGGTIIGSFDTNNHLRIVNDLQMDSTSPRIDYDNGDSNGSLRLFSGSRNAATHQFYPNGHAHFITTAGTFKIEGLGSTSNQIESGGSLKVRSVSGHVDLIDGTTEVLNTTTTGVTLPLNLVVDGKLGINENSLSSNARLQVRYDNSQSYSAYNALTNPSMIIKNITAGASNFTTLGLYTESNGEGAISLVQGSGNINADMTFSLRSSGTRAEHLRITHDGKVGIGTDNPLALLTIKGTGDAIRVESTNTGVGGAQVDLLHYTSSPADGDIPGVINFGGYYSGTASAYSAAIRSVWSNAGGREGQLQFITRQSGSQFDTQLTINHQGHMHLGHDKGSVQFYVGDQGGIMGGNASHNVRGAGNLFMLNAGGTNGSYVFEANGTARLAIANDGVSLATAAPSADSYTHKFRSSNSADPGILLYREGQCGLGITVRNAAVDYASFLVSSSGASTSYDTESGTSNIPLRIYQNGNVCLGRGQHVYNSDDGHIFYGNGRWASTFAYNSAGAEIYIQDNRTASGTVAAFQYRINNSAQSGGTIYAGTNGYTGGNFSDYRLKNNVTNLTGSLDKINALRVVSYNHVDSPDLTELGVIAHEIEEVFPEFVRGEKDAVWTQSDIDNYEGTLPDVEAGDIRAQQVDYFSKEWTSHFIKAIQELKAENEALKTRIEALEG